MRFEGMLDVQPKIHPQDYRAHILELLPPEVASDGGLVRKMVDSFFERYKLSDHLPTPFRKDLFLQAGANLTYYRPEELDSKKIFHFGCYDLGDPMRSVRFSLHSELNADVLSSVSKFVEFIENEIKLARQDAHISGW